MNADTASTQTQRTPKWQPIGPVERRVLGVLIEKAKTTPDYYPMTVAAICAGCNQKSCRSPIMQLEPEDVEEALDRLRQIGAVGLVESSGRALRFRHYAYEWFGVNKVELAVLAELLLRGPQTEGQLRAHVSRMEPIADLAELRTVIKSLKEKGLVISLTPETRGHVVCHTLYLPREMEKIREQFARESLPAEMSEAAEGETLAAGEPLTHRVDAEGELPETRAQMPAHRASEAPWERILGEIEVLRREMLEIRQELNRLSQSLAQNGWELGELRRRVEQLF
ncbi:MAG: YceH family protein [Thermoguttaceae bacterium]|nr:YceH family protein [Thermoguttaceae bacterium]MDW8077778.1 DUF480 domain-containing protein [Thermoguttaceae bacterium]